MQKITAKLLKIGTLHEKNMEKSLFIDFFWKNICEIKIKAVTLHPQNRPTVPSSIG